VFGFTSLMITSTALDTKRLLSIEGRKETNFVSDSLKAANDKDGRTDIAAKANPPIFRK